MAEKRPIPVAWDALEDAFENNAPEVHSFLHLETGDVTRLVDGVAEPGMRARLSRDPMQIRVNAVSSREQYRWMERFIETVETDELRDGLTAAIDGKGAFRRFKDVLISHPVERERWFAFRSERLRACMEAWLSAHDLAPVPRPEWPVPSADTVAPEEDEEAAPPPAESTDKTKRLHTLVDALSPQHYETAEAFLEFLRVRSK
ncbi:MAG: UPF0158 family protein [Myxococcota bacterium]